MKNVGGYIAPYTHVLSDEGDYDIFKLYERSMVNRERMMRLTDEYMGKSKIFLRLMESGKPNHKLSANYARYISALASGYFMGKPISYSITDNGLKLELDQIYRKNSEADHNYELAKSASICGVAYELIWVDTEGEIRMGKVDPRSITLIHSRDFEQKILLAIREYSDDKENRFLEVYNDRTIDVYALTGGAVSKVRSREHYFSSIPIVEYRNNEELQGDFETVLSLIEAYNLTMSDGANDLSYFTDAYLALVGYGATTSEDVAKMREDRVLLLDEGGDAKFLTKNVSDTVGENYKSRLQADIHRLSMVPNLTDESFAGNLSGVAIEYKLFGLEQLAITKERKFEKALRRRVSLIVNMLKKKGCHVSSEDVNFVFHRNIPQNEAEIVDTATKLSALVSRRTMLGTLPMVRDIESEINLTHGLSAD